MPLKIVGIFIKINESVKLKGEINLSRWEKVAAWQDIEATSVSDVFKGQTNMNYQIKPVSDDLRVVGPAYTVKVNAGDNLRVLEAIGKANPGDVLVVDAKSGTSNAICGDFVVGLAQTMGLAGIVIDGVVRDIGGIRALNFPVFTRGSTLAASLKSGSGQLNVPISCGNVPVHPGDIIIGDIDGVVVIPKAQADETLEAAKAKQIKDIARTEAVLGNPEAARDYIDNLFKS